MNKIQFQNAMRFTEGHPCLHALLPAPIQHMTAGVTKKYFQKIKIKLTGRLMERKLTEVRELLICTR